MAYLFGVFVAALVGIAWVGLMLALGPILGTVLVFIGIWIASLPLRWLYRRVSYH
jgi:hypothetical protein